jgi:hypothetical protein
VSRCFLLFGLLSTVGFKSYGILERHENILCGDTVMKLFSINNRRKTFLELRRYHQESEREGKEKRETMEQVLILIM